MQGFIPKLENEQRGYFFTISDEAILEARKRSIEDIFQWLENANRFVYALQTPEERLRIQLAKNIYNHTNL